jgi:hypothetical protein
MLLLMKMKVCSSFYTFYIFLHLFTWFLQTFYTQLIINQIVMKNKGKMTEKTQNQTLYKNIISMSFSALSFYKSILFIKIINNNGV